MNENLFTRSASGLSVPKILYGTAWKKQRTAALVEQALSLGFRGVDTAGQPKHYDEAGVGKGLAACFARGLKRDEIYLQTKFTPVEGQDPERIPYDPQANLSEQVSQSFANSLKNLGTEFLDCLILHSPLAEEKDLMEVWQAMERLFDAGLVKQLGISNCYRLPVLESLYRKARIKPAVLQNRFYANTGYDREIRAFCRPHQILYESFWTLTANPKILAHGTIQRLATRYERSAAQIFFRYLTQIEIIPLTGTTQEIHMQEDLAIFDFALSQEECESIDSLL